MLKKTKNKKQVRKKVRKIYETSRTFYSRFYGPQRILNFYCLHRLLVGTHAPTYSCIRLKLKSFNREFLLNSPNQRQQFFEVDLLM